MSLRYPGGLITKSPTAPTTSAAKGVWTLEQALQYIKAGTWPLSLLGDPYFQYNTILLPGQGTNNTQNNSFLDSGTANSGVGFPVNRNGNTTQGTFTPFSGANGYWGMYNSGSSYLSIADNAAFNLSGTPFTIEAWVYHVADSGAYTNWVVGKRGTGSPFTSVWALSISSTNFVEFGTTGYTWGITSSFPIQRNTWNHIAGTYDGTSVRLYVNGVLAAGPTAATVSDVGAAVTIGNYTVGANPVFTGYISNLRIVKGVAVYTGNFTPPTAPLASTQSAGTNIAAITGTQTGLLTCQSNRFVDNSTNAFAITVNSTPQITPFQPFGAPTSAYSASTVGGSGYFDGSGDYLSVSSSTAFNFGTGNFTIQGWVYMLSYTTGPALFGTTNGATTGYYLNLGGDVNSLRVTSNASGTWADNITVSAGNGVRLNEWTHIALVRNGGSLILYKNGVNVASTSSAASWNFSSPNNAGYIGRVNNGVSTQEVNGYISGLKISNTAETISVPTIPPTNDANTVLLLNYTNAGIIDNAQDNDLETVADAKISTAQYKWGTSSMYFDGTTDCLFRSTSPNFGYGTGDFTIEFWLYLNAVGTQTIVSNLATSGSTAPHIYYLSGSGLKYFTASAARIDGPALSTGTWYHIAVSRTSGSTKMFVNGNQVGSTYADTNNYDATAPLGVGDYGSTPTGTNTLNGYVADLRITKGYARYPYSFTAPTAAFPLFYQAAATPSADPYFDYTTLLLPGNQPSGVTDTSNNVFKDSSANNFTITRNPASGPNAPTQGTFTPFSQTGWSNNFNGSSDWLQVAANTAFAFGIGNFTIEGWVYVTAVPNAYNTIFDGRTTGTSITGVWLSVGSGRDIILRDNSGNYLTSGGVTIALNTWNHIAVDRNSTTLRLYLNGVVVGSVTNSTNFTDNNCFLNRVNDVTTLNGTQFISNFRIVKGASVYNGAFIPPTAPLGATSGGTTPPTGTQTSLLTCQSNRFVDNSTNTFAISTSGSPSVQAFSPFNPTAAYSTSTVGGSGYFDGTGDFLSVTNNAAFNFGSGAFTIEFWYYPTTLSGTQCLITNYGGSTTGFVIQMGGSTAGSGKIDAGFSGDGADITSTNAVKLNSWNHIAISGTPGATGIKLFINGAQEGSTYTGATSLDTSSTLLIGEVASTNRLSGYLSGLRLVKGGALYTANFTPPTSPPTTTVSNGTVSLLTNFTNGAIIDSTAKNDLETVGGASISTTQSKFGGSSMYFDGSGDYLYRPYSPLFALGTGDFTIEWWMNPDSSQNSTSAIFYFFSGVSYFIAHNNLTAYPNVITVYVDNYGGGTRVLTGTTTLSSGTWYHVAITRYSGVWNLYVNGVLQGSTYTNSAEPVPSSAPLYIGSGPSTGFKGYLQDFRVTKGIARYTQNFTPPTTAFLTL